MSIVKRQKNSPRLTTHGSPFCIAKEGSRSLLRGGKSKRVRHFIVDMT